MGQALYRKYRSRKFSEVVGQEHITKTLANAIASGRISHAYLFTGPRGVGKTSVARILAHEVNKLDYEDESISLDIIEIDAASNRRIDEIRDLRDKVRIAPTSAKYKVYIIDEVHMLTREAFNALLKTLEEPPAHCIFILATTEAHKLPETIVSRTQRFEFKPVSPALAASHLADIAKREKITISPEALDLLAEFGNGSFRDSISYLDQLSSLNKKIGADDVRSILGLPPSQSITSLLESVESGDAKAMLDNLTFIEEQGANPQSIAAALSAKLRAQAATDRIAGWQIQLLKNLFLVSAAARPQEALEICLLECVANQASAKAPASMAATIPAPATSRPAQAKSSNQTTQPVSGSFSLDDWQQVLDKAKAEAASIYTALRLAEPSCSEGVLSLAMQFPLHQKKLAQTKNKDLIAKIVKEVSGADVSIDPVISQKQPEAISSGVQPQPEASQPFNAITSIFGASEVMEA